MSGMFSSWRRKQAHVEPRPSSILTPAAPPRPILKTSVTDSGGPSIRFAPNIASAGGASPSPTSSTFSYDSSATPRHAIRASSSSPPNAGGPSRPMSIASKLAAKSSRPHSPSTTSFGQRTRCESAPAASPIARPRTMGSRPNSVVSARTITAVPSAPVAESADAMCTPPLPPVMHITTPPMAYVSSMQTRAPPPPSPYRPTHERQRSLTRKMPQQLPKMNELAPRPPRHSSLFAPLDHNLELDYDKRGSVHTIRNVPVLNVIPATPQEAGDEFDGAWAGPREAGVEKRVVGPVVGLGMLGEAVSLGGDAMEEVPLDPAVSGIPSIEVDLDFSPFRPDVALPTVSEHPGDTLSTHTPMDVDMEDEDIEKTPLARPRPPLAELRRPSSIYAAHEAATAALASSSSAGPVGPLPPSPPFDSYASLPSLESAHTDNTMPSSESEFSLRRSASSTSMNSMDVEHDLGSMLASLSAHSNISDIQLPQLTSAQAKPLPTLPDQDSLHGGFASYNPGLGLGLSLPDPPTITAPLSPRRKDRPEPLDLTRSKRNSFQQEITTAPAQLNARPMPPQVQQVQYRYGPSGPAQVVVTQPSKPSNGDISGYGRRSSFYNDGSHAVPRSRMSMCMFAQPSSSSTTSTASSTLASETEFYRDDDDIYKRGMGYSRTSRDSRSSVAGSVMSVASLGSVGSDGSDDDLHTASIGVVSVGLGVVSPVVLGSQRFAVEEVLDEVGVAL